MKTPVDKTHKDQSQLTTNSNYQNKSGQESTIPFVDNRPEIFAQKKNIEFWKQ